MGGNQLLQEINQFKNKYLPAHVITSSKISYYKYTDDTQFYVTMSPGDSKPIRSLLRTNQRNKSEVITSGPKSGAHLHLLELETRGTRSLCSDGL